MRWSLATLAVAAVAGAAAAQDAVALLNFIPPQANTIAVINTAGILASPRAQQEGWAKKDHTEYLAGAVPLNPLVQRMLLARELHPENPAAGGTLAIMPVTRPFTLAQLAERIGGTETQLGDEPCVVSRTGIYYFALGDQLIGTARSDNKQEIARWLRFARTNKQSQLHRSLNAAAAISDRNHITIAVDCEHMFDNHEIDLAVAMCESIRTSREQSDMVNRFFRRLRAVVTTINITADGVTARVRVDSTGMDLKLDPEFVKAFVVETLARSGAMLEDMERARTERVDSGIAMTFQISNSELARVMSLVLPAAAIPPDSPGIAVAADGPNAQATLRYFNNINSILDDLQKQNKRASDYLKTAVWHDTAANKIEQLSVIGVDPSVVEYAQGTAQRLHMIADSLRGVPAKVEELQGQAYALGFMPRVGLWGGGRGRINPFAFMGGNVQTNVGEIANKQAQVVKDDEKNRTKLWDDIGGKRSEMRSMIAEKYNVVPPERK